MNADLGAFGVWMVIAAMAVVTYAIRAGGFWLMGYVPLTRRVRSILNALPGSVIAAIIVPLAVRGGTAATARSWSWPCVETISWQSFVE